MAATTFLLVWSNVKHPFHGLFAIKPHARPTPLRFPNEPAVKGEIILPGADMDGAKGGEVAVTRGVKIL